MSETLKVVQARYDDLCAKRDAVNANLVGIKDEMAKARAKMVAAHKECEKLVVQLNDTRGRESWLALKKEIRQLADAIMVMKKKG